MIYLSISYILQVLATFRWILKQDIKATYFTVTDDDCLMNLFNIYEFFKAEQETNQDYDKTVYCGYVYDQDSKPFRNDSNKW